MPPKLRPAVSKPPPEPDGEPTREALLAALAERERELVEAREQQAAIAEVLEVINTSPGDLAAVFDAIVEKGARLCDATNGSLWLVDNGMARIASSRGGDLPAPFLEFRTCRRPLGSRRPGSTIPPYRGSEGDQCLPQ